MSILTGALFEIQNVCKNLGHLICEMFSCREKKDAEICSLEGERNRELEELKELEDANQKIRERVENMARQYNR